VSNFSRQLEKGKVGESKIARWLMARGNNILPIYEIEKGQGKGPTVYASDGSRIIAPDILAFSSKGIFWIEAKHKTGWTDHRISGKRTTGIDFHHYKEYQRIAKLVDWPVWLLVLHTGEQAKDSEPGDPGLFGGSLPYLVRNENHRWPDDNPKMVYWAKDRLTKFSDYPLQDESINEWIKSYES